MGSHKNVLCMDCKHYLDVGKLHPARETEWNEERKQWLVQFMHEHMNHSILMVSEYNNFELWGEVGRTDEWEEETYDEYKPQPHRNPDK